MRENRTADPTAKGSEKRIAELERSVISFERKSKFFEMLIRSLPGVFYVIEDDPEIPEAGTRTWKRLPGIRRKKWVQRRSWTCSWEKTHRGF